MPVGVAAASWAAVPCIKLLSLPPPCGSHWLVGGFRQYKVFVCECSGLARRSLHRLIVHLVRLSDWHSLVGFLSLFNGFAKPVVVIFFVLRSGVEGGLMFVEVGFSGRAPSGDAVPC